MTSTEDVDVIRYGLREETDMRVCLLNYRKNGTAFLNQFNLSPLRDTAGKLVSIVLSLLGLLLYFIVGLFCYFRTLGVFLCVRAWGLFCQRINQKDQRAGIVVKYGA